MLGSFRHKKLNFITIAAVFAVFSGAVSTYAETIWVSTSGNDLLGTGSKNEPYKTISFASTQIAQNDTVLIMGGTYSENVLIETFADFVISAESETDTVFIKSAGQGAAFSLVAMENNPSRSMVIENLYISHANGVNGTGLYIEGGSATIRNCTITKNNNPSANGGGVYIISSDINSRPLLENNHIFANTAATGAGIYCESTTLDLNNNFIFSNDATADGGGVAVINSLEIDFTGNEIYKNKSNNGAGIFIDANTAGQIINNRIIENFIYENAAQNNGGAIYTEGNAQNSFLKNTMAENSAGNDGGAVYFFTTSNVIFSNNVVVNNRSDHFGGGFAFIDLGIAVINLWSNTITGNVAALDGGAIYAQNATQLTVGGAANLTNNIFHNRAAKKLNNITSSAAVSNLNLSYNYWGSSNQLLVSQQITIPNINATWSIFSPGPANVQVKLNRPVKNIWFADGKISFENGGFDPVGDSTIVIRTHPDTSFTINGQASFIPKIYSFDWSNIQLSNPAMLNFYLDSTELDLMGNPFFLNLRILEKQDTSWLQVDTEPFKNGAILQTPLTALNVNNYTLGLDQNANSPILTVNPAPNRADVTSSEPLLINFINPMNAGTVVKGNVSVRGNLSGLRDFLFDYDETANVAYILPQDKLQSGEKVTVTLNNAFTTAEGDGLVNGFTWQFRTSAFRGSGILNTNAVLQQRAGTNSYGFSDFDNDGIPEMVELSTTTLTVYNLSGGVSYAPLHNQTLGKEYKFLRLADLDGDFLNEIILFDDTEIIAYKYSASAGFSSTPVFTANFNNSSVLKDVKIADLNNDGLLDMALLRDFSEFRQLDIYPGYNDGGFGLGSSSPVFLSGLSDQIDLLDWNTDGLYDLIASNGSAANNLALITNQRNSYASLINTLFEISSQAKIAAANVLDSDLFKDKNELIIAGTAASTNLLKIFNVDEKGNFMQSDRVEFSAAVTAFETADFNSDGYNDIAVSLSDGSLQMLFSDGSGNLNDPFPITPGLLASNMQAIDYDADGDLDLFVYNSQDNITSWKILENVSRSPRSWFVEQGFEGGNGTFIQPFGDINQAVAVSFEGDSIFVKPGNYTENLAIRHSLLISATDTAAVFLMPDNNDPFASSLLDVKNVHVFRLNGLILHDNAINSGSLGLTIENSDSLLLANMQIRNFDNAIDIKTSTGTLNGVFVEDNNKGVNIEDADLNVKYSNFERNSQFAFYASNSVLDFRDSDFHNNAQNGVTAFALTNSSQVNLFKTSFSQNYGTNIQVINSQFSGQFAFIGEALPLSTNIDGIGISGSGNSRLQIHNSVIADNFKTGLRLDNSNAIILNSIFAFNDSTGSQNGNAIVAINNSVADVTNSIFLGNNKTFEIVGSTLTSNYNDFYQNKNTTDVTTLGTGNMYVNPLFVFMYNPIGPEPEVDNFQNIKLAAGSPLIDKGDPDLTNGNSESRSDIGLYGNLGLPFAIESIPQGTVESQDSSVTISWAQVSAAEQQLWAATAVYRDTVSIFQADTSKMLSILPKSLTAYTDNNIEFGKEYFYKLAYVDTNGGAYSYTDALNGRIDFSRLDISSEKLTVQLGQGDTLISSVTLTNSGTLPAMINASDPGVNWLQIFPAQRLLQRSESGFFRLRFNTNGLTKDSTYTAAILFTDANNPLVSKKLDIEMLVSYRDLIAPLTFINGVYPDTISQAGFTVNFTANDSINSTIGTPTNLLKFAYRFGRIENTTPVVTHSGTTQERTLNFYPLPDGKYFFEVAAIDTAGNGGFDVNSKKLSFSVDASNLSVIPKFWQMITVPRNIIASDKKINPEKIAALRHWQDGMYAFSSPDSVLPGKSYWIFTTERVQLDLNEFDLVNADNSFSVNLDEGWNMIGNPWSWNISMDKLTFTENGGRSYSFDAAQEDSIIDPGIYLWQVSLNERGYKLQTDSKLHMNTGYWIKTDRPLTLSYDPTPQTNVDLSLPKISDLGDIAATDALIQLKVKKGNEQDNDNYFGLCADKSIYPYYLQNAQEPPAIYDNIRLFSEINGQAVTTNLAALIDADSVFVWDLLVEGDISQVPARISWEKLNPQNATNFYLYHLETGEWLNIDEQEAIEIQNKKQQNHFRLFATTNKNFEPEVLPTKFELSQNYPNPFNPSTTIDFAIPYFADGKNVRIDVYDVLGRKIKNLLNRKVKSGTLKIEWMGDTATGSSAASGIYFYHVEAAGFNASKKMILIR
ncbi:MAG: right-handed parallel beta-helix repeat-containing protein [Calditrichae bacterium]|nr:right-handed parallel beta-helix repeat-containing protein [Calditrichia bacterium]